MAVSIQDILLRITGDEDDAERSLKAVATELEAFSRLSATAEAEVDVETARRELAEMDKALDELDRKSIAPEVQVNTALARAEIAGLQRRLDAFERNDLELDVDVRRGLLDDLGLLARNMTTLQRASEAFGPHGKALSDRIADMAVNMGPFTTQLKTAVPLLAGFSAIITAVGAGLAAMAASLAAAVGGIAALAVAMGGVFSVSVLAGFAAFQRFQQQSEKQGTAAHALATAVEDIQGAFKKLLPAMDPVLRALAQIVQAVGPIIRQIAPAFRQFGRAAGDALGIVARALGNPAVQQGIRQLIRLSSEALAPMVKIGVRLGRILLNIANAALPHLVGMLKDVADGFGEWARGTDNAKRLGNIVGFLVSNLKSWLSLIGAIADIFLGFIKAAAPIGQELVDWLTEGAQALGDWMNSAEGQSEIKAFLADMVPLFKELVGLVGDLFTTFISVGRAIAPLVQPIVSAFRGLLGIIKFLADLFNKLPDPIKQLVAVVIAVFNPFNKLSLLVRAAVMVIEGLGGILKSVFGGIGGFISGAANKIKGVFGPALRWVVNAIKDVWEWIKSLPGKIGNALKGLFAIFTWPFKQVFQWIKDGVRTVIDFIDGLIQKVQDLIDKLDAIPDFVAGLAGKTEVTPEMRAEWEADEAAAEREGRKAGKKAAKGFRDYWPGSEPKAHDSPLRHFDRAGQAMMESFVKGMRGGGRAASREMAHGLRVGLGQGARKFATANAGGDGHRRNTFHIPVTVAGGGSPDAQAFVGTVSRRLRAKGLSIQ